MLHLFCVGVRTSIIVLSILIAIWDVCLLKQICEYVKPHKKNVFFLDWKYDFLLYKFIAINMLYY